MKLGYKYLPRRTNALKNSDISNQMVQMNNGDIGLVKSLGKALFQDYVVPFEISSILFLSAMIGAIVIGKRESS